MAALGWRVTELSCLGRSAWYLLTFAVNQNLDKGQQPEHPTPLLSLAQRVEVLDWIFHHSSGNSSLPITFPESQHTGYSGPIIMLLPSQQIARHSCDLQSQIQPWLLFSEFLHDVKNAPSKENSDF